MIARSDRIRMRRRLAVASLLVRLAHAVAPAREAGRSARCSPASCDASPAT
jgi:hypothetical protein